MQNPRGICWDQVNQRFVVSDQNNNRVVLTDRQGNMILQFGSEGIHKGRFSYPVQVCMMPVTNNIMVADCCNHRVQIFTDQGNFVTAVEGTLHYPTSMDYDPVTRERVAMGDICNESPVHGSVHLLDPQLRFIRSFNHDFHGVRSVFFDQRRRLLVAQNENKRLTILSADGYLVLKQVKLPQPMGDEAISSACFDHVHQNQYVVATISGQVHVFDARQDDHAYQVLWDFGSYIFATSVDEYGQLLFLFVTDLLLLFVVVVVVFFVHIDGLCLIIADDKTYEYKTMKRFFDCC